MCDLELFSKIRSQIMVLASRSESPSQHAVNLNSETGLSAWLTVLPLQDQGFHLNKQEFWDALCSIAA